MAGAADGVEEAPKGLVKAELRAKLTGQPATHNVAPETHEPTEEGQRPPLGTGGQQSLTNCPKLGAGNQEEGCQDGLRCSQNLSGE